MKKEIQKTQVILTRVRYCNNCLKNHRPRRGNIFIVYGSSNEYKCRKAIYNGVVGFSPHIILLDKVVGEVVSYYYSCSICNTSWERTPSGCMYIIKDDTFQKDTISLKDWNAWVKFRDRDYYI